MANANKLKVLGVPVATGDHLTHGYAATRAQFFCKLGAGVRWYGMLIEWRGVRDANGSGGHNED
jgi:hypothetical protein